MTLTVEDMVATISLDRPAQRNRLSRAMLDQLVGICDTVAENDAVRAVVVRGRGDDFSTGIDLADPELTEIARQPIGKRRRSLRFGPDSVNAIRSLPQTTIAAMHGYCLGGGGCLALACDLRVAAADLRFGMPEVRRGMNMSWRTVHLMVAHFGPTRTKELLITGRELGMDDAVAWGLANRTSDAGAAAVHRTAADWACGIAQTTPPIAAAMVKETVDAIADAQSSAVHMDTDQFILTQMTEDFREAVLSFMEKRPPRYRGR